MARITAYYYNTAIIPARVRKPKDKPNTERTVGVISTWIIASLRRRQFFTSENHMPSEHREYVRWNGERFLSWAQKIGPNSTATVKAILSAHKIEQQGYRSCMGLLKLADKYSVTRLEAACRKALSYTPHPSFRNVKTILGTGQDKVADESADPQVPAPSQNGFTHGAAYYGRGGR